MKLKKKTTSLDIQFVKILELFILETKQEFDYEIFQVNYLKIIEFGITKYRDLKRKLSKNLENSCKYAIDHYFNERVNKGKVSQVQQDSQSHEQETLIADNDILVSLEPNSDNISEIPLETMDQKLDYENLTEVEGDMTKKKSLKRRDDSNETKKKEKKPKINLDEKWPTPKTKLSDFGGMDEIGQELLQLIFQHLGIDPPRGILLQGAPGCGKTMLAHAIAGEANVPFISIAAPTIVSGMSGESEKKIREVFDEARHLAPCILFIDEIDAITPKRETAQREMERRIVAQLLTCLDDCSFEKMNGKAVIVIGATNRPDSLDPALRRAGRFDREIILPVPDLNAREKIITKMSSKLALDGQVSCRDLAKLTPGFVGADLKGLMGEAGMIAVKRIFSQLVSGGLLNQKTMQDSMLVDDIPFIADTNSLTFSSILEALPNTLLPKELEPLSINYQDFVEAVEKVQPSSKREGFATVPGVCWDDIGALEQIREELRMTVVEPIRHPEYFQAVGLNSAMGVLLFGPPGCGKTLLAKAVANESHCNFLSVKGPELLNKYVGESERAIRMVFSRAQASSPCVIFFDEIDAICPARSNDAESQSSSRLVNTLLTEMDGMQGRKLVFVIAATNRPDMIDPAMLRPGRLDKCLYVDFPNEQERLSILRTLSKNTPLGADVYLESIASDPRTVGMSGADLASLIREASVNTVRKAFYSKGIDAISAEHCSELPVVTLEDFGKALLNIVPSVGEKDRKKYELLRVKFGAN